MAKSYKWDSPQEWLAQKIQTAASENDATELLSICNTLMAHCDADDIQDDFQSEMEADGYFKPLNPTISRLDRAAIVRLLESISIQCYDHETTEELREALRSNVEDGEISADNLQSEC